MNKPEIILFDLGGVIVRLGGIPKFMKWTGMTPDAIKKGWLASSSLQDFEAGRISFDTFADGFIAEWSIPLTKEEFHKELQSWAIELFPDVINALKSVQAQFTTGCLTNTNPVQWPFMRDVMGLGALFTHHFVSYETGYVKPDIAFYQHVTDHLMIEPSKILFFDDSIDNVDAARKFGFNAHLVNGPEAIRPKLDQMELGINWI